MKAKQKPATELWCGRCQRFKFADLFNPAQKQRTDNGRLCMECQKAQGAETRKRWHVKSTGGDWRSQ
jgi:hypothetical protein